MIIDVRYIFKQDKVNDIDYYVYWDYTLVNVSGFEVGTYFENLNNDIVSVILTKLKYGNILRTIYSNISDNQILASSTIPKSLLKSFGELKVRYKKHPGIFGELDPLGLTYALNVTNDDEFFELEKIYLYLKDIILSKQINAIIGLTDVYIQGKDIDPRSTELTQKAFKKQLKYLYNDFYIYLTSKILTLLDLGYEVTDSSGGEFRSVFDWQYVYEDITRFDRIYGLNNYRISKIYPSEKEDQFLSIVTMLRGRLPRRHALSSTHPRLYVVCCLITNITSNLYIKKIYGEYHITYQDMTTIKFRSLVSHVI